jgi:predicted DNA-binding mobile mystery protein A
MRNSKHRLLLEQTDKKLGSFRTLEKYPVPPTGWIHTIRTALNMSLRQLGARLKITAQSISEMEAREMNGSITLKGLKEAARALDMHLVYGFIPKEQSIERMIEKRATELATEIVMRTSTTMMLEDQENSAERLNKAIKSKTSEIKESMPKYLWD